MSRSNTCASGRYEMMELCSPESARWYGTNCLPRQAPPEMTFAWEATTAFGWPDVPDVKMTEFGSSGCCFSVSICFFR